MRGTHRPRLAPALGLAVRALNLREQKKYADAEPLFASLDDKQKAAFIQEMVNLSHERGLD